MDEEETPTEALDASVPRARRLRPWMIIAGGALVVVVVIGIVLALALPSQTSAPPSASKPSSSAQASPQPTSSSAARPSPSAPPDDTATDAEPESDEEPVAAPVAPAPAAPAPAAPAAPAQPALPPPPAPIITPTVTTFTASNYNDSTQTIAQGCAASSNGELSVRITWATANTTPTIKFRTQISGSPVVDNTITGYGTSGDNHFLQLRCAKIAYVTMTLHSDNMERQARLTIDGNGPAGWSYLS